MLVRLILFFLVVPCVAAPSPGKATHVREIVLGEVGDQFHTVQFVRDLPGSYYEHTVLVYICTRSLSDGVLTSRELVRKTIYRTDVNTGEHSIEEGPALQTQVSEVLRLSGFLPAFPVRDPYLDGVGIDSLGIFLEYRGLREVAVPRGVVEARLGGDLERPSIQGVYGSRNAIYFQIVWGLHCDSDISCAEEIVVMEPKAFREVLHRLFQRAREGAHR